MVEELSTDLVHSAGACSVENSERNRLEFRQLPTSTTVNYEFQTTTVCMTQTEHPVHVWSASLEVPQPGLTEYTNLLSTSEKERSRRFRFDRDRERFIAGRGFLRTVLGHYLGVQPGDVEFAYGPNGKPGLTDSSSGIHFNLAHSVDLAVLGVTRASEIGVDVEQIRPMPDADELVERFFSKREADQFRTLPEGQKAEAFFNLWTRKEALLKATGEGIGYLLNRVEVSFLAGERPEILGLPEGQMGAERWSLHHLSPAAGFVGGWPCPAGKSRWSSEAGRRRDGTRDQMH